MFIFSIFIPKNCRYAVTGRAPRTCGTKMAGFEMCCLTGLGNTFVDQHFTPNDISNVVKINQPPKSRRSCCKMIGCVLWNHNSLTPHTSPKCPQCSKPRTKKTPTTRSRRITRLILISPGPVKDLIISMKTWIVICFRRKRICGSQNTEWGRLVFVALNLCPGQLSCTSSNRWVTSHKSNLAYSKSVLINSHMVSDFVHARPMQWPNSSRCRIKFWAGRFL